MKWLILFFIAAHVLAWFVLYILEREIEELEELHLRRKWRWTRQKIDKLH